MKIYTKKGDAGETDLLRRRVKKNDLHIEVNGQLDEVMATIIVTKQYISNHDHLEALNRIHHILYQMAYEIALDDLKQIKVFEDDVLWLEKMIDQLDEILKPLTKFIQLDESNSAAWLNMCRVKTRTAERYMIELNDQKEVNTYTLKFLNRLSDYFFTIGRIYNKS